MDKPKPTWLEAGNASSGLIHILNSGNHDRGHAEDFIRKFGITREDVPKLLYDAITKGRLTFSIPNHIGGVDNYYLYMNGAIKIVITGDGYIVTAHPDDRFKIRQETNLHVILENEVSANLIWFRDGKNDLYCDTPQIISDDKIAMDLAQRIGEMFDSYYEPEPNSHDQPIWFNEEQQKKDVPIMLDLINQLKTRLDEINDGSYDVLDYETERLLRLQAGGNYFIP